MTCKPLMTILCFFLSVAANASMVSFFVIETGLPEDGRENLNSVNWENAFLDVFFDAGHIVSISPMLRLEKKPQGDILREVDMRPLRNGGIEFLIIAQLDYNTEFTPSEMSFLVYRVNTRELITEKKMQGRQISSPREGFEYMKSIARGLIAYIDD